MTNNTQLVSVPRELLERINKVAFLPVAVASDLWDVLAAPAEDVCAVVEEPFGYWCHPEGNPALGFFNKTIEPNTSSFCDVVPLYRQPQRPVVLPERLRQVWLFLDGQAELDGCVFGEKPEGRHNFWWRKELRAVLEELYPAQ
jgi:hypothetical protein